VHCAGRTHYRRIVDGRTIQRRRLTVRSVRPRLIDLAWCSEAAKSAIRHPKRREDNVAHQVFPRLSADALRNCAG
jgi:hypothetical protein